MILSIKNYVSYNLKELFKKGHLVVGVCCKTFKRTEDAQDTVNNKQSHDVYKIVAKLYPFGYAFPKGYWYKVIPRSVHIVGEESRKI